MSSESLEKAKKDSKKLAASKDVDADERDEEEDEDEEDEAGDDDRASQRPTEAEDAPREKIVLDRPGSGKMVWTIFQREMASYFNSAITYIVIGASMIGLGLYFFLYKGGFWQVNRVTMTRMFDSLPAVLCAFVIPLFTMRALSDEKRVGTIELLITMPVKDSEVILGKYFAALGIVAVQLLLVVLYPVAMFWHPWTLGALDWGAFWVGMLGLLLLSAAGTAVGLMYSSFTESQILSFFGTAVTLAALYFLGNVTTVEFMQGWPGDAVAFVSLQTRFEPFSHGLLDTRAVIFFLSIAILCLMAAFRSLESRKWS